MTSANALQYHVGASVPMRGIRMRSTASGRGSLLKEAQMSAESQSEKKVLVIGANGRVGRRVVHQLCQAGILTRCMTRDINGAQAATLSALSGVEMVQGDVTDPESVQRAMSGCNNCVACFGAERVASFADFFSDPTDDPRHPYSVNYQGVVTVVKAAQATPDFQKLVRVTGLSVGYSAFSPVAVLLNLVLSFTIKYQTKGEQAIRSSGLDYTIIRPGSLRDETPPDTLLRLSSSTGLKHHPVGKTGREDVASLIVASLHHPNASRCTFGCTWAQSGEDPKAASTHNRIAVGSEWVPLMDAIAGPDTEPLNEKPHELAVRVFLATTASVLGLALWLIAKVVAR